MINKKIILETKSLTKHIKYLREKNLSVDEINDLDGDSLENQIEFQNEQIKFKSELPKARTTNRRRR
ncbi:TPA: hypothetical protein NKT82_001615 [Vibrio parahaemolyticus]|uniref:hypothetical protein n=1 Tax=Vibrio parahaemolyticus TaxID=670 RepID=UPI00061B33CF|nr:hypothetical protein [Vibrio parahaemolyticus]KKC74015.1 hypothetical protein WR32_08640 [Vibrio parahaemolyticus]KKX73024.1 hypothetical protein UF35_20650 [Vibrio parahaemolyticus]NEU19762.1 hypothetical protein [Vibrio parahaemolyticus]HCE2882352.1 hypothetical protein [Vibrio parahaemolyticus]HCE2893371.1 hypothetical protein [Vibrio parahaemolyticus]